MDLTSPGSFLIHPSMLLSHSEMMKVRSLFSQELILSSLPGTVNYTRKIRSNKHATETDLRHEFGREPTNKQSFSHNVHKLTRLAAALSRRSAVGTLDKRRAKRESPRSQRLHRPPHRSPLLVLSDPRRRSQKVESRRTAAPF